MTQKVPVSFVLALAFLFLVGLAGWRISGMLSSDALGMALGIMFGVLAGLPMALMLLASQRRRRYDYDDDEYEYTETRRMSTRRSWVGSGQLAAPGQQSVHFHQHYHAAGQTHSQHAEGLPPGFVPHGFMLSGKPGMEDDDAWEVRKEPVARLGNASQQTGIVRAEKHEIFTPDRW